MVNTLLILFVNLVPTVVKNFSFYLYNSGISVFSQLFSSTLLTFLKNNTENYALRFSHLLAKPISLTVEWLLFYDGESNFESTHRFCLHIYLNLCNRSALSLPMKGAKNVSANWWVNSKCYYNKELLLNSYRARC